MNAVLADVDFEIDFDLKLDDDEDHEKCHISCLCNRNLGLCGAYKSVKHGVALMESVNEDGTMPTHCPICKKLCCPTCMDMAFQACPYCGRC